MSAPIQSHRLPGSEQKKGAAALRRFRAALVAWFRREGRDLPWRHTRDPYAILVSEFMLQQTQVATVVGYYRRWMERFPDAVTLAAAPQEAVLSAWQGLGYYSRARNLQRAASAIVEEHGGIFPKDPALLRSLPGVGRYTAAAVATFAFDLPTPPVDGNIARVLARLLDFREPVDAAPGLEHLWAAAAAWQPRSGAGLFNEAMMELGALVCTPRQPACGACPVRPFCAATAPEALPVKKPRPALIHLEEACGFIHQGGQVLLERQTGRRWRGLFKLPLLAAPGAGEPLLRLDYPFTRHRITLSVFAVQAPRPSGPNQEWVPLGDLPKVPITAPHRRALEALLANRASSGLTAGRARV